MKNLKYLFIAALMVFGFSACEDVPAPYDIPTLGGNSGNGSGGGSSVSTPEGEGTLESPYNPAGVNAYISTLEADVNSDEAIYVKGIVCSIKEKPNSQYGNATFYISADGKTSGEQFYVYRCYNIGNKKFTDSDVLNVGDEVIIYGKVVNYRGNTPETVQKEAYIYSHNATGEKEEEEIPSEVMTVAQAIAAYTGTAKAAVVKGYIVGWVEGTKYAEGVRFNYNVTSSEENTEVVIADTPDETDPSKCMPIQLPIGDIRNKVNLLYNPGNYKKMVTLTGSLEKYFGVPGLKSVSKALFDGEDDGESDKEDDQEPLGNTYINETFATGLGSFTAAQMVNEYPWKHEVYNEKAYAKVSGYNGTSQDAESWLISPTMDFSNETAATINFDYVINKGEASLAAANHKLMITASYSGDFYTTTWEELDFGAVNDGTWTFRNSGNIAVPAEYLGKEAVVIAFKYTSTTAASSTWEVMNVTVTGEKGGNVSDNTGGDNTGDNEQGGDEPGTGGDNTGDNEQGGDEPGAGDEPGTGGDNTGDVEEEPLPEGVMSVTEAIAAFVNGEKQEVTVTGYIVGYAASGGGSFVGNFTADGAAASNLLIAATPNETDSKKCLPVQLPSNSDTRTALNLKDNPTNLGKKVTFTASLEAYFSSAGLKTPTAFTIE